MEIPIHFYLYPVHLSVNMNSISEGSFQKCEYNELLISYERYTVNRISSDNITSWNERGDLKLQ